MLAIILCLKIQIFLTIANLSIRVSSSHSLSLYGILHFPHFYIALRLSTRLSASKVEGASVCQYTNICVFCGSSRERSSEFVKVTNNVGQVLVKRKLI